MIPLAILIVALSVAIVAAGHVYHHVTLLRMSQRAEEERQERVSEFIEFGGQLLTEYLTALLPRPKASPSADSDDANRVH